MFCVKMFQTLKHKIRVIFEEKNKVFETTESRVYEEKLRVNGNENGIGQNSELPTKSVECQSTKRLNNFSIRFHFVS